MVSGPTATAGKMIAIKATDAPKNTLFSQVLGLDQTL